VNIMHAGIAQWGGSLVDNVLGLGSGLRGSMPSYSKNSVRTFNKGGHPNILFGVGGCEQKVSRR